MKKSIGMAVALLVVSGGGLVAATSSGAFSRTSPVASAISSDATQRQKAIETLRAQGESGLRQLQIAYADDIAKHRANASAQTPNWNAVKNALSKVGGQYDNWASGLFWHTDLERAKSAAKKSGKPILSLRLLGRLDEDLSCANSRFFRTALYANTSISQTLNDKFVLHWSSERPAPLVTIDMGDGRTLKRTLTGNSVHYLMDREGRVLDALPGLYGPGAFARWLDESQNLDAQFRASEASRRDAFLADYHRKQIVAACDRYAADYEKANRTKLSALQRKSIVDGFLGTNVSPVKTSGRLNVVAAPSARSAGEIAVSKSTLELPILNATRLYASPPDMNIGTDFIFSTIAPLHASDAQLDESSKNLMRAKTPQRVLDVAPPASQNTQNLVVANSPVVTRTSSQVVATPINVLQNFQNALALDTVRNTYRLHVPIHKWFADGEAESFATLNAKIYNDLFWTPRSDPWLGLSATGSYTALDNDGVQTTK